MYLLWLRAFSSARNYITIKTYIARFARKNETFLVAFNFVTFDFSEHHEDHQWKFGSIPTSADH